MNSRLSQRGGVRWGKVLLWSVAGLIVMSVIGKCAENAPHSPTRVSQNCDNSGIEAEAYTLAQRALTQTLNVPNSADFPFGGMSHLCKVADNNRLCSWRINSTVEAKNLYGVVLERRWNARVKYDKSTGRFVVDFAKVAE